MPDRGSSVSNAVADAFYGAAHVSNRGGQFDKQTRDGLYAAVLTFLAEGTLVEPLVASVKNWYLNRDGNVLGSDKDWAALPAAIEGALKGKDA